MDRELELQLVDRLRTGDPAAFDAVHEAFNGRLYNFLARLSNRRDVAEDLLEETYVGGTWGAQFPGDVLRENPAGLTLLSGCTLLTQALDVAGVKVGTIGLLFEGDRTPRREASRLGRIVDVVAEELDTVLVSIHTAFCTSGKATMPSSRELPI